MKRGILLSIAAICVGITAMTANFVSAKEANKAEDRTTAPAASTTLTLSQVYGGGGGTTGTYMNDYVEIKNISGTSQSLSGLSLMYGSATGQFGSSATNIFALPAVSLNPGQYYLVQLSSAGTGGIALPVTPDATTTNLSMSGTNGKVALVNATFTSNTCGATATPCTLPNTGIIDLVSWGTANNAEGNAPTNAGASLTSTQGNVRKGNGCTDTDNNNADNDIITAPVPRNTATTPAPCGAVANTQHVVDYNGDGKTDYTVVRNTGGGSGGQMTWFTCTNGVAQPTCLNSAAWGISTDTFVSGDFDGDHKSDLTVWRSGAPGVAGFYILQSATSTVRYDSFGQTGDDPKVVADYDGDGKTDPAVYRAGVSAGQQSYWYYRQSAPTLAQNEIMYVQWGLNGDFPAPGDYDGDGKSDFMIQRNNGGGQAIFWMLTGGPHTTSYMVFGTPTDIIAPGDFNGDGKTDVCVVRGSGGAIIWNVKYSTGTSLPGTAPAADLSASFGASATDYPSLGDYDGDGKTDLAVWRPSATSGASSFFVNSSASSTLLYQTWGANGDYPPANFNTH